MREITLQETFERAAASSAGRGDFPADGLRKVFVWPQRLQSAHGLFLTASGISVYGSAVIKHP